MRAGAAKSAPRAAFVLVNGAWHNASAWGAVKALLKAGGFAVLARDLPGAGANSIAPASLAVRPFDPAAFAAEPLPGAGVTQQQRTEATVAVVREAASFATGKVILVGHSAGGMTISAVPELLGAIIYLAGFMVPNGMTLLSMLRHEALSSAVAPGLFVGDPLQIGATRIDVGSSDAAYRTLLKTAFYGDVAEPGFAHAASQLHCDESNAAALTPPQTTPGRFGSVPRHYIRCTQDRAVPLTGQDHMIAADDHTSGGSTATHTLESSQSPFLSQPVALSGILADFGLQS